MTTHYRINHSSSYIVLSLLLTFGNLQAQERTVRDSINNVKYLPCVTTTYKVREKIGIGQVTTSVDGVRSIVSPLGEGDPIKWVQNMPGVTTGADGTSAFYVRGGNMGNNLFSLDGVPVYGYSHLLGMTTIVSQSVMQDVTLSKGGFDGNENNFTSAHINVESKTVEEAARTSVSLNTFLMSAYKEGRIAEDLSYIASARISPLTWEYRAIRNALPDKLGSLDDFSAGVGDLYGKLRWDINGGDWLEASVLGSIDNYSFSREANSDEQMGWGNVIAMLRWHKEDEQTETNAYASFNYYSTIQKQDKMFRGEMNHLSLQSGLAEFTADADRKLHRTDRLDISYGLKARYSKFQPGNVASVKNSADVFLVNAFLQCDYSIPECFDFKAFVRSNGFDNLKDNSFRFDPEAGLSAKLSLGRHFAITGTVDRLVQFYHTLEGMPVGWSIDMLVPSGKKVVPEKSLQESIDLSFSLGRHHASVGGFYKMLDDIVYYKYAENLFSGGMAAWEDDVAQGKGTSYGFELLYAYQFKDVYTRASYTWSKTDRRAFEDINGGKPFNARFDRRHVMNIMMQWKGLNTSFVLQSRQWENSGPKEYTMHVIGGHEWVAEYFNGINTFLMPMVMRLDIGYQFEFQTEKLHHELNVGVCNVTNHFNPFMLYFDSKTEQWTQIALLPIMPTFSYSMNF